MIAGYKRRITFALNGESRSLEVDTRRTLLDVLRDELDLTGTKRGCDRGECGACVVLLDGLPVNSCMTLAALLDGESVETVEGLADGGALSPIQRAFLENDGAQCGFCSPGFLMSATALLRANPDPTDAEIKDALAGNICRCNAYGRIIASVRAAAKATRGEHSGNPI